MNYDANYLINVEGNKLFSNIYNFFYELNEGNFDIIDISNDYFYKLLKLYYLGIKRMKHAKYNQGTHKCIIKKDFLGYRINGSKRIGIIDTPHNKYLSTYYHHFSKNRDLDTRVVYNSFVHTIENTENELNKYIYNYIYTLNIKNQIKYLISFFKYSDEYKCTTHDFYLCEIKISPSIIYKLYLKCIVNLVIDYEFFIKDNDNNIIFKKQYNYFNKFNNKSNEELPIILFTTFKIYIQIYADKTNNTNYKLNILILPVKNDNSAKTISISYILLYLLNNSKIFSIDKTEDYNVIKNELNRASKNGDIDIYARIFNSPEILILYNTLFDEYLREYIIPNCKYSITINKTNISPNITLLFNHNLLNYNNYEYLKNIEKSLYNYNLSKVYLKKIVNDIKFFNISGDIFKEKNKDVFFLNYVEYQFKYTNSFAKVKGTSIFSNSFSYINNIDYNYLFYNNNLDNLNIEGENYYNEHKDNNNILNYYYFNYENLYMKYIKKNYDIKDYDTTIYKMLEDINPINNLYLSNIYKIIRVDYFDDFNTNYYLYLKHPNNKDFNYIINNSYILEDNKENIDDLLFRKDFKYILINNINANFKNNISELNINNNDINTKIKDNLNTYLNNIKKQYLFLSFIVNINLSDCLINILNVNDDIYINYKIDDYFKFIYIYINDFFVELKYDNLSNINKLYFEIEYKYNKETKIYDCNVIIYSNNISNKLSKYVFNLNDYYNNLYNKNNNLIESFNNTIKNLESLSDKEVSKEKLNLFNNLLNEYKKEKNNLENKINNLSNNEFIVCNKIIFGDIKNNNYILFEKINLYVNYYLKINEYNLNYNLKYFLSIKNEIINTYKLSNYNNNKYIDKVKAFSFFKDKFLIIYAKQTDEYYEESLNNYYYNHNYSFNIINSIDNYSSSIYDIFKEKIIFNDTLDIINFSIKLNFNEVLLKQNNIFKIPILKSGDNIVVICSYEYAKTYLFSDNIKFKSNDIYKTIIESCNYYYIILKSNNLTELNKYKFIHFNYNISDYNNDVILTYKESDNNFINYKFNFTSNINVKDIRLFTSSLNKLFIDDKNTTKTNIQCSNSSFILGGIASFNFDYYGIRDGYNFNWRLYNDDKTFLLFYNICFHNNNSIDYNISNNINIINIFFVSRNKTHMNILNNYYNGLIKDTNNRCLSQYNKCNLNIMINYVYYPFYSSDDEYELLHLPNGQIEEILYIKANYNHELIHYIKNEIHKPILDIENINIINTNEIYYKIININIKKNKNDLDSTNFTNIYIYGNINPNNSDNYIIYDHIDNKFFILYNNNYIIYDLYTYENIYYIITGFYYLNINESNIYTISNLFANNTEYKFIIEINSQQRQVIFKIQSTKSRLDDIIKSFDEFYINNNLIFLYINYSYIFSSDKINILNIYLNGNKLQNIGINPNFKRLKLILFNDNIINLISDVKCYILKNDIINTIINKHKSYYYFLTNNGNIKLNKIEEINDLFITNFTNSINEKFNKSLNKYLKIEDINNTIEEQYNKINDYLYKNNFNTINFYNHNIDKKIFNIDYDGKNILSTVSNKKYFKFDILNDIEYNKNSNVKFINDNSGVIKFNIVCYNIKTNFILISIIKFKFNIIYIYINILEYNKYNLIFILKNTEEHFISIEDYMNNNLENKKIGILNNNYNIDNIIKLIKYTSQSFIFKSIENYNINLSKKKTIDNIQHKFISILGLEITYTYNNFKIIDRINNIEDNITIIVDENIIENILIGNINESDNINIQIVKLLVSNLSNNLISKEILNKNIPDTLLDINLSNNNIVD